MGATPDRRELPRLAGTGKAWPVVSYGRSRLDVSYGVTDGSETVYRFKTKSEAVLAAWVHNMVHGHQEER